MQASLWGPLFTSPLMENLAKPLAISLGSYALWRLIRLHVSSDALSNVPGPGGNQAFAGKVSLISIL